MTLEERIIALEQTVADLRDELAKRNVRHSMARTRTCPACGGGTIFAVTEVKDWGYGKLVNLSLNPTFTNWRGFREGDRLRVYVCKECRLVEWHTWTLDHLVPDGKTVVVMRRPDDSATPPSDDPYR